MATTPQSEPTVKDLLPLLTTAEDRKARIKAVLTPKRTVQAQGVGAWGYLGMIPPGSLVPSPSNTWESSTTNTPYSSTFGLAQFAEMEKDDLLSQPGGVS